MIFMTKWQALWLSIRPYNLLIMVATMAGVYGAIVSQLEKIDFSVQLFSLLVLSIVLIGAGGNLYNDIEDIDVDLINRPEKNYVNNGFTKSCGMKWYFILTLSGLLLGLVVSLFLSEVQFIIIAMLIVASLWLYNKWLQKTALAGNFIVAILCALLPFLSLLFAYGEIDAHFAQIQPPPKLNLREGFSRLTADVIAIPYIIMAFSLTLARELIKDIQDIKGDDANDYRTFPVIYGFNKSKILVIFILVLMTVFEVFVALNYFTESDHPEFLLIIFLIFIFIPILISIYSAFKSGMPRTADNVSKWLKITMALGISTTAFFWFL